MRVPWLFPLPPPQEFFRREEGDDPRLYRMFHEGDLPGGAGETERMAVDRRFVVAMLDPTTPNCQINKMLPDDPKKKRPPFSEDRVLTLLHCTHRGPIQQDWDDKRKKAAGHKRIAFLGPVTFPNGKIIELAVSFRRYQQFFADEVSRFQRIASLLEDVGGTHAGNLLVAALEQFQTEGDPKAKDDTRLA